jgi:hypothetical protein
MVSSLRPARGLALDQRGRDEHGGARGEPPIAELCRLGELADESLALDPDEQPGGDAQRQEARARQDREPRSTGQCAISPAVMSRMMGAIAERELP